MADITMPKLSDTMTEGTLVKWKKKVGDAVTSGEVLAEVETDKATMEMESFEDGILTEIFIQEGEKVAIGQIIARVGDGSAAPAKSAPPAPAPAKSAAPAPAESAPTPAPVAVAPAAGGRVHASPLAKKVAKARGVDLSTVQGSGPGGRIVQKDVLAATPGAAPTAPASAAPASTPKEAPAPLTAPVAAPAPKATPAAAPAQGDRRIPLSGMRRAIAERLLASKTQIPHFYLHVEVDAGPLMRLRAEMNQALESEGVKFSVNDLILKATVAAIARHPKVNAAFDRDAIVEYEKINLSVAVAVDEGLVTPVIRDARNRSLSEISAAVKDLATRARSKKLKPDEYQGGTFTVSNLGGYGIDQFDAIINPPQSVILSVGRVMKKPVVNERDEIVVGERLNLGVSCDHRVVDGAIGAEFLATLKRLLEHPAAMLA